MTETWLLATLWIGLALIATLFSIRLGIATVLAEIVVGTIAQLIFKTWVGSDFLGTGANWIVFLSSSGAIMVTFLAGAELDPEVFKLKWKEASSVGLVGFILPFLGCTAVVYYLLHWDIRSSWLAGVVLSTSSVAVVYSVMLECGLNATNFGKTILAACFINCLGTILALGLLFSPFTLKTLIFLIVSIAVFVFLPWITTYLFKRFGGRPSEIEAKYLLLFLFGLGGLAAWSHSEPVLPAYMIGMVLAGTIGKNHTLIRRLRTLTFGLLTPFYFIRAGSFVSVPALISAPLVLLILLLAKIGSKFIAIYPVTKFFKNTKKEGIYATLLMSAGLTFGIIAALFGLSHGIIDREKYSFLIGAIIGCSVIPTLIANAFYLPGHLLPRIPDEKASPNVIAGKVKVKA